VPSIGAGSACSIFIASTVTTTVPAVTGVAESTPTATTVPGIGLVVGPHGGLLHLGDHNGARGAGQPDLTVICGDQIVTADTVQRDGESRSRQSGRKRAAFALLHPSDGVVGPPGDVDVIGAPAGLQPDACRGVPANAPSRRVCPQIVRRVIPALEPAKRRGRDQIVVRRCGGGEVADAAVQQAGVEPTHDHVGIRQQEAEEFDVGHDPEHGGVGQRSVEDS